jgi:hypothetical protein
MTGNAELDNFVLGIMSALIIAAITALAGSLRKRASESLAYRARREREERSRDMILYRMAVYDEHFSTEEKLQAYQLYRAAGGNHQTKYYMDSLLGEDVDVYLEHHGKEDGR